MTTPFRNQMQCPQCGTLAKCQTCGTALITATPFSQWLRALSTETHLDSRWIDNENLDYVWFAYREGWLILIEEKRYGSCQTAAQADTHNILDQLLRAASGTQCNTLRGQRLIDYRGYYVVVFSATTPDDSEWITINGQLASVDDLLKLLGVGTLALPTTPLAQIAHVWRRCGVAA